MHKWIIAIIVLFLALGLIFYWKNKALTVPQILTPTITIVPSPTIPDKQVMEKSAIFVPYWDIPDDLSQETYDRYFYFGIAAGTGGIIKNDAGYNNLTDFVGSAEGEETYLTVRMLDQDANLDILEDEALKKRIISGALEIASQYGFEGIILDFELSTIPFTEVKDSINALVDDFYIEAKQQQMSFMVALYGDVFYRPRPFDVSFIVTHSDEILVMAYDLHKPSGEPGPNFPLDGQDKYGYDLKNMITDYLQVTTPDKLTIVFGMYGYDWIVDDKKKPLRRAKALSLADIKEEFIDNCEWKNCLVMPDNVSAETEINYVDSSSEFATNHIVWFEDERSVSIKKEYLRRMGIGQTAYWVYGYF